MGLFQKQPMFCCICGAEIQFGFNFDGVPVCDLECWHEYQRRRSMYIMGEKYRPKLQ